MVHTQMVAGLRDSQLRRRLMANDDLTLDQVIAQVKSAEITKQQDQILQNNASTSVDVSEAHDENFNKPNRVIRKQRNALQRKHKDRSLATNAALSQVFLLIVVQPKMLRATYARRKDTTQKLANLRNAFRK